VSKDRKKAIKHLFKEIQSATLPEITSANFKAINYKNRAAQDEKKMEYIHEEFYDNQSKGKWTIFNKHAIEVDDYSNNGDEDMFRKEDHIIDEMRLNHMRHPVNICLLPESTWIKLY
jgi:hypothetical protein